MFVRSQSAATAGSPYIGAQPAPLPNIAVRRRPHRRFGRLGMDEQQNPVVIGGPSIHYEGTRNVYRYSSPGYWGVPESRTPNAQPVIAPAPASVLPTAPPPGSYKLTCSNMDVSNGVLTAQCLDMQGRKQAASLDLANCIPGNDIANLNGNLACGTIPAAGVPFTAQTTTQPVALPDGTATAVTVSPQAPVTTGTDWGALLQQYWWVGAIGLGVLAFVMKGRR